MIDSFFVTSTCMKVENDFFKILTMLLQRKFSSLMMSQRYTNNIFTNQFKEKKKVCVYFFLLLWSDYSKSARLIWKIPFRLKGLL